MQGGQGARAIQQGISSQASQSSLPSFPPLSDPFYHNPTQAGREEKRRNSLNHFLLLFPLSMTSRTPGLRASRVGTWPERMPIIPLSPGMLTCSTSALEKRACEEGREGGCQ